jgi:hypothetical protein
MKYFDLVPVGQLVTRSVSDIESIARIFVKVVYDYQWLNENGGGAVFHVLNWLAIDLDCDCGDACFSVYNANISA